MTMAEERMTAREWARAFARLLHERKIMNTTSEPQFRTASIADMCTCDECETARTATRSRSLAARAAPDPYAAGIKALQSNDQIDARRVVLDAMTRGVAPDAYAEGLRLLRAKGGKS